MIDTERKKNCFVIAPISSSGTDVRRRSDQVVKHIIEPVVSKLGYQQPPVRADKIAEPSRITDQIIGHLLDDELVIADLTGQNANVFYELVIRHAIRRPVVVMIAEGEKIPFDVSSDRVIQFNYRDLDSVARCKEELENQIHHLDKNPNSAFSPISDAIDLKAMRESGDPSAQTDARILSAIYDVQANINRLDHRMDVSSALLRRSNREEISALDKESTFWEAFLNAFGKIDERPRQRQDMEADDNK